MSFDDIRYGYISNVVKREVLIIVILTWIYQSLNGDYDKGGDVSIWKDLRFYRHKSAYRDQ